jgi:hypothetical protein
MAKKKSKPTRQQIVANKLVKQSEQNELLSKKIIKGDFFKLFTKK